jgi:Zn finger protein HypA/HybF involved in hydrogenase expression
MICLRCNNKMKCYDDVNYIDTRIDFVQCPMCDAKGEIIYKQDRMTIDKVNWKSGNKYK